MKVYVFYVLFVMLSCAGTIAQATSLNSINSSTAVCFVNANQVLALLGNQNTEPAQQKMPSTTCSKASATAEAKSCSGSTNKDRDPSQQQSSSTSARSSKKTTCSPNPQPASKNKTVRKCSPRAKTSSQKTSACQSKRQVTKSYSQQKLSTSNEPIKAQSRKNTCTNDSTSCSTKRDSKVKATVTSRCKAPTRASSKARQKASETAACKSEQVNADRDTLQGKPHESSSAKPRQPESAKKDRKQVLMDSSGLLLPTMGFRLLKATVSIGFSLSSERSDAPGSQSLTFQSQLRLQPIPESTDVFIQAPRAVDWDEHGSIYVLDASAQSIHQWDSAGRYVKTFGNKGEGPGEFAFSTARNSHQPTLTILNNEIWVYDDGPHQMEIFDHSGTFKRQIRIKTPGHLQKALPLTSDILLILYKDSKQSKPTYQLGLYHVEKEHIEALTSLTMPALPDRNDHFLVAYRPFPSLQYHAAEQIAIAGNPTKPEFLVYKGRTPKAIKIGFSAPVPKLQERDKCEFKAYEEANYDHKHPLVFPEIKPYYTDVIPLSRSQFLVVTTSPQYGIIKGSMLNRKGDSIARVEAFFGDGGRLLSARGKLLAVKTDLEGQFHLDQVIPAIAEQNR